MLRSAGCYFAVFADVHILGICAQLCNQLDQVAYRHKCLYKLQPNWTVTSWVRTPDQNPESSSLEVYFFP